MRLWYRNNLDANVRKYALPKFHIFLLFIETSGFVSYDNKTGPTQYILDKAILNSANFFRISAPT